MKKITSYVTGITTIIFLTIGIMNYLGTLTVSRIGLLIVIPAIIILWVMNKYINENKLGTTYRVFVLLTIFIFGLIAYVVPNYVDMYGSSGFIWFRIIETSFGLALLSGVISLIKKN